MSKRSMVAGLVLTVLALLLSGCNDAEERYDVGYDDGYASGYNTTCKIRATLIEGDFDNGDYKRGYNEGYALGSAECRKQQDQ